MKNKKKIYSRKCKHGFTLMELLVSLGIIAALSMIMTPMIMGKVQESKIKADISNANSIAVAVKTEILEGANYQGNLNDTLKQEIANKYFDGILPKPQSIDGNFNINVTNAKLTISVAEGDKIINFYPYKEKVN